MKFEINNLSFSYTNKKILSKISFELNHPEIVCLIGQNGAGKSTLIKCMNRILNIKDGSIKIDEQDIKKMNRIDIAKKIAYVPQSITQEFNNDVFNTILMGRRPHLGWKSSDSDLDIVMDTIKLLNLEKFSFRYISELSGGEKQKVFLARAFVQDTDIILLDEPTSNLDIKHQFEILNLIKELKERNNKSIVIAIHDINLASRYADRIVLLKGGEIIDIGKPVDIITEENLNNAFDIDFLINKDTDFHQVIPIGYNSKEALFSANVN